MIVKSATLLGFPSDAISYLSEQYAVICSDPECEDILNRAAGLFMDSDSNEYKLLTDRVAERSGISRYTVDMLMLLLTVEPTHKRYVSNGISDRVFIDTMSDLRHKLIECKDVYNCWGTFVGWWFRYHTSLRLFTLGRLQFEPIEFPFDGYKGIINKGDRVYNCHIPSGGSLDEAAVLDSFKLAYEFFGAKDILPIYCSSWLIYPKTAALYRNGSNLKSFYEMYDIIGEREDTRLCNFWRVFNTPYSRDALENAPEDNSLRRDFKKYLLGGGSMGDGQGIILFDGEKIVGK